MNLNVWHTWRETPCFDEKNIISKTSSNKCIGDAHESRAKTRDLMTRDQPSNNATNPEGDGDLNGGNLPNNNPENLVWVPVEDVEDAGDENNEPMNVEAFPADRYAEDFADLTAAIANETLNHEDYHLGNVHYVASPGSH